MLQRFELAAKLVDFFEGHDDSDRLGTGAKEQQGKGDGKSGFSVSPEAFRPRWTNYARGAACVNKNGSKNLLAGCYAINPQQFFSWNEPEWRWILSTLQDLARCYRRFCGVEWLLESQT
jgi:hypothetical protein